MKQKPAEFAIENNIPLPAKGARGFSSKYPVRQLQVGQSFIIKDGKNINSVRSRMRNLCLNISPKFKVFVAQVDGGFRVWRMEDRP